MVSDGPIGAIRIAAMVQKKVIFFTQKAMAHNPIGAIRIVKMVQKNVIFFTQKAMAHNPIGAIRIGAMVQKNVILFFTQKAMAHNMRETCIIFGYVLKTDLLKNLAISTMSDICHIF
jgi:cytochrome b